MINLYLQILSDRGVQIGDLPQPAQSAAELEFETDNRNTQNFSMQFPIFSIFKK